jgi:hypothetical protein
VSNGDDGANGGGARAINARLFIPFDQTRDDDVVVAVVVHHWSFTDHSD